VQHVVRHTIYTTPTEVPSARHGRRASLLLCPYGRYAARSSCKLQVASCKLQVARCKVQGARWHGETTTRRRQQTFSRSAHPSHVTFRKRTSLQKRMCCTYCKIHTELVQHRYRYGTVKIRPTLVFERPFRSGLNGLKLETRSRIVHLWMRGIAWCSRGQNCELVNVLVLLRRALLATQHGHSGAENHFSDDLIRKIFDIIRKK
jgi:hypothetical protein